MRCSLGAGGRTGENDRTAGPQQRESLLHGEQRALDVDVEDLVKLLARDGAQRGEVAESGIGEQHIDGAFVRSDGREEPIEILRL
jgi:hypothetical protein